MPERLALDVPERHVDAAHGVQADAAPAAVDVGAVHLVPDLFGLERIFADHDLRQAGGRGVRERPVDRALHGHRVGIDLADAGDAGVGLDAHDQGVLAAVALELDLRLAEVDGFDASDFHDVNLDHSVSSGRAPVRADRDRMLH